MKRNHELELLQRRLDEVRMSERERIRARAHLERAEAIASLLASSARAIERAYRRLVVRPLRRMTAAG